MSKSSSIDPQRDRLSWEQLRLLPDEVIEATLRIGVVIEADHLQWQLDVRDPRSGDLISMQSRPVVSTSNWLPELTLMVSELHKLLGDTIEPF